VAFSLRIAVLGEDEQLRRVCLARGHRLVEPEETPDVLAAETAAGLLLVRDGPARPAIARFRVVARPCTDDRLADELELAYVGIPASVERSGALDQRVG
jgi:hypothetical protein